MVGFYWDLSIIGRSFYHKEHKGLKNKTFITSGTRADSGKCHLFSTLAGCFSQLSKTPSFRHDGCVVEVVSRPVATKVAPTSSPSVYLRVG
jgi:hypothetical protein